ncbi:50S ribosomal protein L31 [Candidatus Gottesmanbacteria bacterium RBG_16_37_8]|uniref:Large ribosomal subunit protein bL31 n=1 Tax=Candidatus Gottesmanbacteria bacterium RBG_16_37_8 TaxID=1798371 RepID=A0A1F5YSD4_9BACT|nr:MAG: 50S ribosomal protein L31 [Candidatus Gottesmanbacteria bacterium RBG_16_37_8]
MKSDIHPKWYIDAQIICACGNMFKVGSTKPQIKVEVCHKCHPFFTGEMKFLDTLGRVEKFQKRQKEAAVTLKILKEKKKKKAEEATLKRQPKTLREMLLGS